MNCADALDRLDDDLDGELSEEARRELEAHLRTCPDCRRKQERLRALLTEASALPRSIEPTRDLWAGIESRISAGRSSRGGSRFRPYFLAAAAVILMALSSAGTALLIRRGQAGISPFASARTEYTRVSEELARQVAHSDQALSPATLAIVTRNLQIIDAAIRESEEALARDPNNRVLEQLVLARYQERLDLLKRAARVARES